MRDDFDVRLRRRLVRLSEAVPERVPSAPIRTVPTRSPLGSRTGTLAAAGSLVVVLAAALVVAGHLAGRQQPAPSATATGAIGPIGVPVWLLTHVNSPQCALAAMNGYLAAEPTTGLGLGNGLQTAPVSWPDGFTAAVLDGRLALIDATGEVRAREGDYVATGGGLIGGTGAFGVCPANGPDGIRVVVPAAETSPSPAATITESQALSTALRNTSSTTPVRVVAITETTFGQAIRDSSIVSADTSVFAIELSGTFAEPSCGPMAATPRPCPPSPTSSLAIVDARTGAWIASEEPAPSPLPSPSVATVATTCVPDPAVPSGSLSNPCPSAIAATLQAVSRYGLVPLRVSLAWGNFGCAGYIWPGAGTEPVCFGAFEVPGRDMHGWVSFAGSPKVAAVELRRDLPADGSAPPSPPPWHATVIAFEVPPAGFAMP